MGRTHCTTLGGCCLTIAVLSGFLAAEIGFSADSRSERERQALQEEIDRLEDTRLLLLGVDPNPPTLRKRRPPTGWGFLGGGAFTSPPTEFTDIFYGRNVPSELDFHAYFMAYVKAFEEHCPEYLEPDYRLLVKTVTVTRGGQVVSEETKPEPTRVNPRLAPFYVRWYNTPARSVLWALKAVAEGGYSSVEEPSFWTQLLFETFECDSNEVWQYENHLVKIARGDSLERKPAVPPRAGSTNETVTDPETGLEWLARDLTWDTFLSRPGDRRVSWYTARQRCEALGSGWRLPSFEEAVGLKNPAAPRSYCGDKNDMCRLRLGIEVSGYRLWTSEESESEPGHFYSVFVTEGGSDPQKRGIAFYGQDNIMFTALCVRSSG